MKTTLNCKIILDLLNKHNQLYEWPNLNEEKKFSLFRSQLKRVKKITKVFSI